MTSCQPIPGRSGWFRPRILPNGENHRFWAVGLSSRVLERFSSVEQQSDGSRVFIFMASRPVGNIYLWDRISDQYNSPAVASTERSFRTYATLDLENLALLENFERQLRILWPGERTPEQKALLNKLYYAIEESRRLADR